MSLTRLSILAMTLLLPLAGCGKSKWDRPGSTQADFNRELADCDTTADPDKNIPQNTPIFGALHPVLTEAEQTCLRRRGWVP